MIDINTAILAVILGVNTVLLWSIGKMTWEVARMAGDINRKTDELLKRGELSQETLIEILKAMRKSQT